MHRQIKFRAWAVRQQEMEMIKDLYWFEENGVHNDGYGDSDIAISGANDSYVLMQFTGLVDCDGVDIYEGDVVEYSNGPEMIKNIVQYEINYEGDGNIFAGYLFDGSYNVGNGDPFGEASGVHFKVIGNVFEHPHFLEADGAH